MSIWLSAGFCLFLFSCTTRNNGETYNTDEITYRVDTGKELGEEVDSIRYLPLLKSDQHLVSEATKLKVKNSRIVIFEKKTYRVVSYDTNGHFLYEINHRGKGNKEYLEIANITVSANYIYLLDNFKHKLNVYDIKDGSFVRSTDIPFVAWDLESQAAKATEQICLFCGFTDTFRGYHSLYLLNCQIVTCAFRYLNPVV